MDIWNYIRSNSNYGYIIDKGQGVFLSIILGTGGQLRDPEYTSNPNIYRYYQSMRTLYTLPTLSEDTKRELGRLMHKMKLTCYCRFGNVYSDEEQLAFLSSLSESEKAQLEEQIKMRQDCETFYRTYCY